MQTSRISEKSRELANVAKLAEISDQITTQQKMGKTGYEIAIFLLQNTTHDRELVIQAFESLGYTIKKTTSHLSTRKTQGFRISAQPHQDLSSRRAPQKVIWQRNIR